MGVVVFLLSMAWAGAPEEGGWSFPNAQSGERTLCPVISSDIVMAGDVMMHGPQLQAGKRADGSYRFHEVFEPVAPYVRSAALAIANLETVTAGEEQGGYTSYPLFNSPESLLDALADAGFDILQTANNHSLDRGLPGLLRTLEEVDRRGMGRAGTFRSVQERTRPWVRAVLPGQVTVAFLATTYSTNMIPLPRDRPWSVSLLDDGWIEAEIAAARQEAELVIVGAHWGEEYRHVPDPEVVRWARRMVDAGADVVMGTHPHVLQPAEILQAEDAHGKVRDALVIYSLGNFVSNQRLPNRDGGALARLTVSHCEDSGQTWLERVSFMPTWVDVTLANGRRAYRVLPTPAFGAPCEDLDLDARDCARIQRFRDHAAEILGPESLAWRVQPDLPVALGFDWVGRGLPGFSWRGAGTQGEIGVIADRGEGGPPRRERGPQAEEGP